MVSKLNSERQPGESAGGAMSRIYSRIGFIGLWNGLPVRIVMIGTLTGLQWYLTPSIPFPLFPLPFISLFYERMLIVFLG
jgi:hypothetical protein